MPNLQSNTRTRYRPVGAAIEKLEFALLRFLNPRHSASRRHAEQGAFSILPRRLFFLLLPRPLYSPEQISLGIVHNDTSFFKGSAILRLKCAYVLDCNSREAV